MVNAVSFWKKILRAVLRGHVYILTVSPTATPGGKPAPGLAVICDPVCTARRSLAEGKKPGSHPTPQLSSSGPSGQSEPYLSLEGEVKDPVK